MEQHIQRRSITFLLFNFKNNGGNRVILNHASKLKKRGWDAKVVSCTGGNREWFAGEIEQVSVLEALFTKHERLVATFWPTAYVSMAIPSERRFYFIQGREYTFYTHRLIKLLVHTTYKLPLKLIATSQYIASGVRSTTDSLKSITIISALGIDATVFYDSNKRKNNNSLRILSVVTSYTHPKGIDILHKAVSKLKKQHPEYTFTLISTEKKVYSGAFDAFFTDLTDNELASIYRNSDVLLATGRSEGFFLPGLEAMASGVLFVTTDSGGIREYVKDGHNAIILKKISSLWEKDIIHNIWKETGFRKKLVANGIRTAKRYNWNSILNNVEKVYMS